MPRYMYQIGLRIDHETLQKIKFIAKLHDRSFNNFVLSLIKDRIKNYEMENGPIAVEPEKED